MPLPRKTRIVPAHERAQKPWSVTLLKAIRPNGTLLWPEHNSLDQYKAIWHSGSPALFRSVWMQDPSGLAGELFHPEWFRYFAYADDHMQTYTESGRVRRLNAKEMLDNGYVQRILEEPASCTALQAHDLAISQTELADFYARVNVLASRQGDLYVTDVYRQKLTDLQMVADMTRSRMPKPKAIGVEAVAFQEIVLNAAKREARHMPFVKVGPYKRDPVETNKYKVGRRQPPPKTPRDKVIRARPLADHFERGQVYLHYGAHWEQATRFELMGFPSGAHDDVVDALAYCYELATDYAFGHGWHAISNAMDELQRETRKDLAGLLG